MLHGKIEPRVTIKLPVSRVAGVTSLCAPNLSARVTIACKGGRSRARVRGRVNRPGRPRLSKQEAVRVQNKPADVCFLQSGLQARRVSAFRQPKPGSLCPEEIDIDIASDQNLGACGFTRLLKEHWKQTVRGGGGDNFKRAGFSQPAKSGEQIIFAFIDKETPTLQK